MIAVAAAGCSADTTRFKDNPFSSPMAARPAGDITGSMPASRIDAQPLPPPPTRPNVSSTGATAGPRVAANAPAGAHARPAPAGGVHVVAAGQNLSSIARLYGKSPADIAKANKITVDAKLKVGQRITIPGIAPGQIKTAAAAPAQPPAKPVNPAKPAPASAPQAATPPAKVATTTPTATARLATPATETPEAAPETTGATPSFRWPVRGRIIATFGAKANGQPNDGINLSVPEGTSVKAAEEGVVAYAGNELKGYGNLVLVRHAGGYVTAYAHASEVMVKRGDRVKRGQIIARAGQTGNVTSPQLHFEIRKGASPVDPMQHLNGG